MALYFQSLYSEFTFLQNRTLSAQICSLESSGHHLYNLLSKPLLFGSIFLTSRNQSEFVAQLIFSLGLSKGSRNITKQSFKRVVMFSRHQTLFRYA